MQKEGECSRPKGQVPGKLLRGAEMGYEYHHTAFTSQKSRSGIERKVGVLCIQNTGFALCQLFLWSTISCVSDQSHPSQTHNIWTHYSDFDIIWRFSGLPLCSAGNFLVAEEGGEPYREIKDHKQMQIRKKRFVWPTVLGYSHYALLTVGESSYLGPTWTHPEVCLPSESRSC